MRNIKKQKEAYKLIKTHMHMKLHFHNLVLIT